MLAVAVPPLRPERLELTWEYAQLDERLAAGPATHYFSLAALIGVRVIVLEWLFPEYGSRWPSSKLTAEQIADDAVQFVIAAVAPVARAPAHVTGAGRVSPPRLAVV